MVQIENRIGQRLTTSSKKVLEVMFAAYSQLIVKSEFTEGFSGSHVFLVRPVRQGGRTELPSVVKIDDFDRIEKEWEAYQDCIRNRLPNVAKISGKPVFLSDNQSGGLRYPLAGDGAFDVVSLNAYCQQASIDEIDYVLKRLFKSMEKLWEQKNFHPDLHLHTFYDSFLHPNLLIEHTAMPTEATSHPLDPDTVQKQSSPYQIGDAIQLSGFQVVRILRKSQAIVLDIPAHLPGAYRLQVQNVPDIAAYKVGQLMPHSLTGRITQTRTGALQEQATKILGAGVDLTAVSLPLSNNDTLPNPLVALPKLLSQSFDAYTACIHADLHMGNVLVEPESGNIHLIDFVNAREDHVLRDFLNLELAIVNRLIPAALDEAGFSPKRIISFYERLHCALQHPGQISAPPRLEKPFAMLRIIRESAVHYLFKRDARDAWREYYFGLVLYLLGSLRYNDLDDIPGAKQTAFWGAAAVLKILETKVPCEGLLEEKERTKKEESGRSSARLDPVTTITVDKLRRILTDYFNESELQNLIFDLGEVDYENLPGKSKEDKARELIAFLERRGRVSELVQLCYRLRPNAPWDENFDKEDLQASKSPPLTPVRRKGDSSGGVHFEGGGPVHIQGDVVGGNQRKTVHVSPSSKPGNGPSDTDNE